tara:strand:+ start:45161 stop:46348 length:1188 start_codon:yes stop_codon:yes gene_type:complete
MKKIFTLIGIFAVGSLIAQDTTSTFDRQAAVNNYNAKPGKSKFMLRGFWFTGLDNLTNSEGESSSNFIGGGFNPILLYRQSDRLFFEAELEGQYDVNGGFELGLGYANASYVLNNYMTIRAGQFLLPFGTFTEKMHPSWINKVNNAPLGFGHDGISPMADIGMEIRGAFYTGSIKLNYQAYVINGPQLKDGSDEPDEAGGLKFGYMTDNNKNKTVGGRIGILPLSNSSLEIGFSGMTGKVGTAESKYEDVTATLYAIDLSFVKNLNFMKSVVDIKGQYNGTNVSDADYLNPETGADYTFENKSSGYYAQIAVRPSLLENKILRNFEAVARYSVLSTAEESLWAADPTQLTFGLNYWLDWRTVVKIGYQTTDGLGDHDTNETISQNLFYVRVAMGF